MGIETWFLSPLGPETNATLAEVNERLRAGGLSISAEDARALSARRAEALAEAELVEFGTPAIVQISEAVAMSASLSQGDVARDLARLQDAFYAARAELSVDVPDEEIVEALRGCLDAWDDAATVASMPAEELMRFSAAYVRAYETQSRSAYRIVDDEGHLYVFDPSEWEYDEQADGWDGERWADDWDD